MAGILRFSKPIKGFVQNNGIICGNCGISFETHRSLVKHWTTRNCDNKQVKN